MKAHELIEGTRFHVVGLPATWEAVKIQTGAVLVRPLARESRTFSVGDGDEVTISFRPKAFYISRETSVEVDT